MTALGTVLAVFTDVATCDRDAAHQTVLTTDGQRAYAYGLDSEWVPDYDAIGRTGVTLTATCGHLLNPTEVRYADAEPVTCEGLLAWRLDTPGGWTADADSRRLLTAYGIGVDQ